MSFGLPEKSAALIIKGLARWDGIQKAVIFGSRATGKYKNGSDVDLAIYGSQITPEIVSCLSTLLNEDFPLPYYFDIVHYEAIKNDRLKEQIDNNGKTLWERT